jgi:methylaspartate ammonia-lyase
MQRVLAPPIAVSQHLVYQGSTLLKLLQASNSCDEQGTITYTRIRLHCQSPDERKADVSDGFADLLPSSLATCYR